MGFFIPNHDEIRQAGTNHPLRADLPIPLGVSCLRSSCFAIFEVTCTYQDVNSFSAPRQID
jgi:hypothetical protein